MNKPGEIHVIMGIVFDEHLGQWNYVAVLEKINLKVA